MVLNAKRRTLHASISGASATTEAGDDESDTSYLEPWADFLRRTAQWTDQQLENAGLCQWTVLWKRKKWQWAAKLMESGAEKWSTRATLWQPLLHSCCPRGRKQARPKKRWEHDLADYVEKRFPQDGKCWQELARDRDWWFSETERFANE